MLSALQDVAAVWLHAHVVAKSAKGFWLLPVAARCCLVESFLVIKTLFCRATYVAAVAGRFGGTSGREASQTARSLPVLTLYRS